MLKTIRYLLCLCTIISVGICNAQDLEFYMGNSSDSVSIINNNGKLVAKILWQNKPVYAKNDTICVSILSSIIPPKSGGVNYALSPSFHIYPKTLSSVQFDGMVTMRIYTDTSQYKLSDLQIDQNSSKAIIYKYNPPSIFTTIYNSQTNFNQNYIEFYLDSIDSSDIYICSAMNIYTGIRNQGDPDDTVSSDVFVPANKSLVFNPGFRLTSTGNNSLIVKGSLVSIGSESSQIYIEPNIRILGDLDTNIHNNIERVQCKWVQGTILSVYGSNALVRNCTFNNIGLSQGSSAMISNTAILRMVGSYQSVSKIDSCHFLSGGTVTTDHSIIEVSNSCFDDCANESQQNYSFVIFRNNLIYAKAFTVPFATLRCLIIYDGNKILLSGTDNGNSDGISVYYKSYAIIRNNIVSGFRYAVSVGYDNKAVIYNNTFINNNSGIRFYATVDSVAIYNNIFCQSTDNAIDLLASTNDWTDNRVWINNNLWYNTGWYYIYPATGGNNPGAKVIIGNTYSINKDPQFIDSIRCRLQSKSPAIDRGAKIIPAFKSSFQVLDTTIYLSSSITLSNYSGESPDIGAIEYNSYSDVNSYVAKKCYFALNQNYPNPFNPVTTIKYAIPKQEHVTLKVYNVLGKEVATLVNGNKTAGEYTVSFNGSNLASGIYFYRITAGSFTDTKKLILLK